MDFDLRQWLLILGPLFIAGVLVHGYFRMRAGQNSIRMRLDKEFVSKPGENPDDVDDLKMLRAELPNGGARVIRHDDLEEDVPVLMESVDLPSVSARSAEDEEQEREEESEAAKPIVSVQDEPRTSIAATPKAPPAMADRDSIETASAEEPAADELEKSPQETPTQTAAVKPEKFVVLHVLALDDPFNGQALVELLVEAGMVHGEMNIFHRLGGSGQPRFSLANAVEPGTFDMATIASFSTPGVTMFMRVHELQHPLAVLDEMLGIANAIAQELGGEVRDETRSVMTPQTIEHCRQSIREFQFKHSA